MINGYVVRLARSVRIIKSALLLCQFDVNFI